MEMVSNGGYFLSLDQPERLAKLIESSNEEAGCC